jgi:hypothetical protein
MLNCRFDTQIRLTDASRSARLQNAAGPALAAERLYVRQDMQCDGLHAEGAVMLHGGQIGGRLNLANAKLCNPIGTRFLFVRDS